MKTLACILCMLAVQLAWAQKGYDYIGKFKHGKALVQNGNLCGMIDKDGNEVTKVKYEYIGPFKKGLATIQVGSKTGLIDMDGNEIVKLTE